MWTQTQILNMGNYCWQLEDALLLALGLVQNKDPEGGMLLVFILAKYSIQKKTDFQFTGYCI
jgi:hypothetical protein